MQYLLMNDFQISAALVTSCYDIIHELWRSGEWRFGREIVEGTDLVILFSVLKTCIVSPLSKQR